MVVVGCTVPDHTSFLLCRGIGLMPVVIIGADVDFAFERFEDAHGEWPLGRGQKLGLMITILFRQPLR
jgi:hypothetical protein